MFVDMDVWPIEQNLNTVRSSVSLAKLKEYDQDNTKILGSLLDGQMALSRAIAGLHKLIQEEQEQTK